LDYHEDFRINLERGEDPIVNAQTTVERDCNPLRMIRTNQHITERKLTEGKLKRSASVFSHAHEGIMITDVNGIITEVNATLSLMTGYDPDDMLGNNHNILISECHSPEFQADMWDVLISKGNWRGEVWNRRKNGEIYPVLFTISDVKNSAGVVQHYVSLSTDISLIKENQDELEPIVYCDPLTSLPNRALLADRLNQAMLQCQRRNQLLAVALIDFDGFKNINHSHEHNTENKFLIAASIRMKEALREGDTLARIDGDEFVAIIVDLENAGNSVPVLERLLKTTTTSFDLGDGIMQVSASIGVAFYPQDSTDAEQLISHANQAMYGAKRASKNCYQQFDNAQDNTIKIQLEFLRDIRSALDKSEFVLHYQPKVNMHTGDVIGVEALIRWQHPISGLIPSLEFLSLIEGRSISLEVGEWVIGNALKQISNWQRMGVNLPISINISTYQLQQNDFATRLSAILAVYPEVNTHYLELEILETSMLSNISEVSATMNACHQLGVSFALDDFGKGYSSLNDLRHLPVQMFKIDKIFVRDMLENIDDLAIVKSVVGLAKAFHRDVIAEGVETIAHVETLLQLGCELAQGYSIARPMPSDDIPKWFSNWKTDGFGRLNLLLRQTVLTTELHK
jgi:diguanylate cyclase (GGDEF)-like protein/PAS domain S-box-containing protein